MSDERDGAGSADDGADTDSGDTGVQTAVVTRPLRPTGKRSRRGAAPRSTPRTPATMQKRRYRSSGSKDDGTKKGGPPKKTAKKPKDGASRNPIAFV